MSTIPARRRPLSLQVNGVAHGPIDVPEDMMLVDVLHEYLGLTGTRFGCGQGECRACTVIVDDERGPREVRSCITGAHYFDGKRIRTVEGHARRDDAGTIVELSPVQQAFLDHFSFQCGYCTPGFVNAATVLLERLRKAPISNDQVEDTISEALNPHLCRCTGYVRYYQAVKALVLATPGLVKGGLVEGGKERAP
ncbi:(2Fe-2S)-binding protein [Lysobacter sp. S4-A87]|uniref:(2Fe-2S)-binding protein n=1 Tax=Lysobacter sp. S4-A87 TaxID=2925843 RepID=UPI001F53E035|nr:(2Fe-2S)-binding protein [Lysobacter sp. S4-A87]UNK50765.1 (2Fe-2S)-binding protein [Lysobacter sp. S4-A87]